MNQIDQAAWKSWSILLLALLLFGTSALSADLLNQKFAGKYRKTSKTSIVRNSDGTISPAFNVRTVRKLKKLLGPDDSMRVHHPELDNKQSNDLRTPQELRNVELIAWLYDTKHQDDNDFHIILGSSSDTSSAVYLNSEISGLPNAPGDDKDKLLSARQQFLGIVPSGRFSARNGVSPIRVKVVGSVLFDGDHQPGCATCPGPAFAKPQSVWEIHPIISIERVNP